MRPAPGRFYNSPLLPSPTLHPLPNLLESTPGAVPLMAPDMAQVDALIRARLTSDVALVNQISSYIIGAGGKRIRPQLVLLFSSALGFVGPERLELAAIVEFIHTATLLHDDVIDQSALRRGRATANSNWGNAPTVLVGDFLYSRAFQLMASLDRMDIIRALADATNVIAAGEVQQLAQIGNSALTEAQYMDVIRGKTAVLFEAAAHTAALLADCTPDRVAAMRSYGLNLGMAYQLIDDVLDYDGNAAAMGKNVGDDLAEGKMTLPLIRTMTHGQPCDAQLIKDAIAAHSLDRLDEVVCAVRRSGALEYTRALAVSHAEAAIAALAIMPAQPARDSLVEIARFSFERTN